MPNNPQGGLSARVAAIMAGALLLALFSFELTTSWLQSRALSAIVRRLAYTVEPGPSPHVPYPHSGPYDNRLGYTRLPGFLEQLSSAGYDIAAQARASEPLSMLSDRIGVPIYREKTQAGLKVLDRSGEPMYAARHPQRTYPDFESIPPPVVTALLFVENREMLDERYPRRNPAVEWDRLGKAVLDLGYSVLDPTHPVPGGSTLATQLEKMRHSPGGRTGSAGEKLRQMASASLRAYLDGEETLEARRRIVLDYLNSMPLAALPGYGEVTGLGDGLFVWFGADFETVTRLLRENVAALDPVRLAEQARALREVLSLLLAIKKPTSYLTRDRTALDARVDAYLRLLSKKGAIDPALCDAALRVTASYRDASPQTEPVPFADRKAADAIRTELSTRLGLSTAYDVDRLDLTVRTTIDRTVQQDVTRVLRRLGEPAYASRAGLDGYRLLGKGDPSAVTYSFSLFERTAHGNELRVQADSYDRPLNINEGTKLELGSTAKLRTLVHYLEIIADLHERYAGMPPERLMGVAIFPQDRLTRWAVNYLNSAQDTSLPATLEAALSREYSANPQERFFTGGGVHRFANFDPKDDGRVVTVREAFRKSINLVFIRLMRDIVAYHACRLPDVTPGLLENPDDPARRTYLSRFADREGRLYLARFHEKYRGVTPDEMLRTLVRGVRAPSVARLAVIHRSVRPGAGLDEFSAFVRAHPAGAARTDKVVAELYDKYGAGIFTLQDRGYLAGVHPLELWLLEYRNRKPGATLDEVLSASAPARQEVYGWLAKTRHKSAQDSRIRIVLEVDAFREIHRAWKRLGFPFDALVPSCATALGSSGDNPAALAELMGILVNDGVRSPTLRISRLHFAQGTPLETVLEPRPSAGTRVLPSALAGLVKHELAAVVKEGTARRISGAAALPDGTPLALGGKTGTGDNRYELFARGGRPLGSRVVNRTATFVFMIGDRYYGTVTAFVPGPQSARYAFTSALPVQVLKHLAPTLMPLLSESGESPS